MATDLQNVGNIVARTLNELRPLFVDDAELSFIMRRPGDPDSSMIVSNDNLMDLSEMLAKIHLEGQGGSYD